MSSRRKQGRPQQRKTLDSLEQENDLLVCGDCQTSFPLHDIVQFIKHKGQACSKDKDGLDRGCKSPADDEDDKEDGDKPTDLSSGHKAKREGGDWGGASDRGSGTPCSRDGASSVQSVEMRDDPRDRERDRDRPPLKPRHVDAEANTMLSEPSRFVCETCRLTLTSAWCLLQHAQKEHGMKIYNSGALGASPSGPGPHPHGPTPQPAHAHPHGHAAPPPAHTPDMTTPSPRPSLDHRTPPSSAGSGPGSPFPSGHPLNPFTPFRMPLDGRLPPSPFNRPPGLDLPLDLLEHYRRPPMGTVVMTTPPNLEPHFAHAAFDRRPMSTLESQIYSQRLKQLANTTLPPGLVSPLPGTPFSQSGVLTPVTPNERASRGGRDSVGSGRDSGSTGPAEQQQQDDKGRDSGEDRSQSQAAPAAITPSSVLAALPSKLKSCEFCGKMFRFQSNLIVHRRSHTGEKPFKCPLCPHACTQQSKLKRHMKTHAAQTRGQSLTSNTGSSDGSVRSATSTPDSTRNKDDLYGLEDDENDDDMDDEEEEDEEDDDMDEDLTEAELDSGQEGESNDGFQPTPRQAGRARDSQSDGTPEDGRAPTPTQRSASASLVSEVMKHSGLNSIQPYNEAFRAALAEKFQENGDKEGNEENQVKRERSPSSRGSGSVFSVSDMLGNKNIKREPGDGGPPGSVESSIPSSSLFTRARGFPAWLHGDPRTMPSFFPGFPPTFAISPEFGRDSHNGFSAGSSGPLATSDSALKVPASLSGLGAMSKPGPSAPTSLLTPSNGSTGSVGPRSKERRNDTCEFCGKVFKNCSNLTVHRRSHTGEKPYKCSLCNYACAQSSKLTRHMKTHGRLGKDVFKCKFCNMPFSVPSTLEKHMRKCVESRNARILAEQDNSDNSTSAPARSTPQPGTPDDSSLDKDLDRRVGLKADSWSY